LLNGGYWSIGWKRDNCSCDRLTETYNPILYVLSVANSSATITSKATQISWTGKQVAKPRNSVLRSPALWILAPGKSEVLVRLDNQPSASFAADVGPDPLQEDAETQAALSKKLYVDQCPDKPREEATDLYTTAL
jgi:hypothetical protein